MPWATSGNAPAIRGFEVCLWNSLRGRRTIIREWGKICVVPRWNFHETGDFHSSRVSSSRPPGGTTVAVSRIGRVGMVSDFGRPGRDKGEKTMQNRAVLGWFVLLFAVMAVIAVAAGNGEAGGPAARQAARTITVEQTGM